MVKDLYNNLKPSLADPIDFLSVMDCLYAHQAVDIDEKGEGYKDEVRHPIRFKDGPNVVLGKEDGTNSIGKLSALLAIDFVFGGNTYTASDGVKYISDYTIFFTFKFDGKEYYFA